MVALNFNVRLKGKSKSRKLHEKKNHRAHSIHCSENVLIIDASTISVNEK